VLSYIERAKQELVEPSRFQEFYADTFQSPMDEIVSSLYGEYQRQLQSSNAVDFGDLLSYVVYLWRGHREILEKYQRRFHYVLVDEYQDTNSVQYEFCHLLSRRHKNLFVVGDDCQSIYSFRGARIENILNFSTDNHGTQNVVLDQNYRSTQQILDVANAVIAKNNFQQKKVLWTQNKKGKKPQIVEVVDEVEEAEFICGLAANTPLNSFVVLYRTNAQSRIIEEALLNEGIPYRIVGGVRFYDRKEIKDIIGYLRIILNPFDSISLERVINTPSRGVGQKTWEALKRSLQLYNGQFDKIASLTSSPKIASFLMMIQTLAK
jgi:DNA helicase-2/ATP-dependent DNA helicase PcrA